MATCRPAARPTLAGLSRVIPAYGARFDRTLDEARAAIGDECDPANADHAAKLRSWLNKWICHIRVPSAHETDPFIENLAAWWIEISPNIPDRSMRLGRLADEELESIAHAYGSLVSRVAAVDRNGKSRTFGPTATAKILYFVRPLAVTAWDRAIARHVPGKGPAAFLEHMRVCRSWANELIEEAANEGLGEDEIGSSVGRPMSSVAKLIDEWLYQTMTRNVESGPKMS
jgi:hypothetical protein